MAERKTAAMFWSDGWGALIDRFNIPWMVNTAGLVTACARDLD